MTHRLRTIFETTWTLRAATLPEALRSRAALAGYAWQVLCAPFPKRYPQLNWTCPRTRIPAARADVLVLAPSWEILLEHGAPCRPGTKFALRLLMTRLARDLGEGADLRIELVRCPAMGLHFRPEDVPGPPLSPPACRPEDLVRPARPARAPAPAARIAATAS